MSTRIERRHEAARQEIIDAAWELAERQGIAGISLRDVAASVGMRAPSLYTYFDRKDAIYDAMFIEGFQALNLRMELTMESRQGADRVELLGAAADAFVQFCQSSPARYQLMFTYAIPGWAPSPEAYAISVASYERSAELLSEVGITTPEARDLYTAVVSGLAAQQMANDPNGDRWRRLSGDAMEMLTNYVDRAKGAQR